MILQTIVYGVWKPTWLSRGPNMLGICRYMIYLDFLNTPGKMVEELNLWSKKTMEGLGIVKWNWFRPPKELSDEEHMMMVPWNWRPWVNRKVEGVFFPWGLEDYLTELISRWCPPSDVCWVIIPIKISINISHKPVREVGVMWAPT